MKIDLAKLAAAANDAAKKAATANKQNVTDRIVRKADVEVDIAKTALSATRVVERPSVVVTDCKAKPEPAKVKKVVNNANLAALLAKVGANNSITKPKPEPATKPIKTITETVTADNGDKVSVTHEVVAIATPETSPNTPDNPNVTDFIGERAATKSLTLSDLDPSQVTAIDLLSSWSRAVLVGSAGTGKSTTVNFFLDRILPTIPDVTMGMVRNFSADTPVTTTMAKTPSIAFVSYTGIATQRLASKLPENLQRNCMTIHRLLGYYPEIEEYYCNETFQVKSKQIFVPYYTSQQPLQWDTIIIDEAGMVPAELWNNLCAALLPHTRVYLVGDIAQLPPIMGTSPLTIAMRDLPTAELTKVHRTENDWITQSAQRIRVGRPPDFDTPVTKFLSLDPYPDRAASQIVAGVIKLFREGKFDPTTDAIITATNVNDLGQENLNRKLCKHFNPDNEQVKINAVLSRPRYAVGDKIMVTKNDDGAGLANGMIGYITDIQPNPKFTGNVSVDFDKLNNVLSDTEDTIAALAEQEKAESQSLQASHILTAYFPDCYADDQYPKFATGNSYSNIQHAYAITCHKAQGGEFRQIVIVAHSASGRMLNREWFYTAWTRAKRNIIVLGNMGGINKCLNNQQLKGKTAEEKVAHATRKIEHKLRQASKSTDYEKTAKINNSIPQILTTEKL